MNPYLNTPPTKLKRDLAKVKDPAKKKKMTEALNSWRLTVPGPFRKGAVMARRGTKTAMAKRVVAESADQAYKRVKKDIDVKMKRLHRALDKHDKEQKKETTNWGYVGDYGHIHEQLDELVRFLNG